MQLKRKRSIGESLATATCSLLGALPATRVQADESSHWQSESALLYYAEDGDRVRDLSFDGSLRYAFDEDRALRLNLTVDSLSGASPSGAVPANTVQTFTRPSGQGSYQVPAGELPLDDTFLDTRIAMAVTWSQLLGESRVSLGVSGSTEYDYLHLGVNGRWERDFNQRNTTVFVGLAYAQDQIDPVGGAPIPFAAMQEAGDSSSKRGNESKDVIDGLLGFTQILSRRSLLSVNYSYGRASGYLTDPYRVLTVVDPLTGQPVADPAGSGLDLYLYESRPDSRTKQSLFAEWRYAFDRDSLALNYRIMHDDWGITSSTAEARYRLNWTAQDYLEPHLRYYTQSAADFYRTYLVDGEPLPENASPDHRLADLDAVTVGLKYGRQMRHGEFSVRLEYYRQTGNADPAPIGVLTGFDLVPPLSAVIAQFGYTFDF
jgi:hypothetical protein